MTKRINQDGTQLTYAYQSGNGRLHWIRDAQNRQTTYAYTAAGLLQSVTHPNLPTQSYTYNALGQRLTWSDGGQTTAYSYDSLDRLASVDGPLANDTIAYSFDQWQRLASWSYDGASESYAYDNLDRVVSVTNPLGTFAQTYVGHGGRLASVAYPLAGMETAYTYLPAAEDLRLSGIAHTGPGGAALAAFGYSYNSVGEIAAWSRSQPGMDPGTLWTMRYDRDRQLLGVYESVPGAPPAAPKRLWGQHYDASGNRTLHQRPGRTETAAYNARNQLTTLSGGGATVFRGSVSEPAQVSHNGKPARVFADGTFEASLALGPGVRQVVLEATDQAANTATETWQVDDGSATRSLTYDVHGHTLHDGMRSYTWDAYNRLTGIAKGGDVWTVAYNGANLRTSESKNGEVQRAWVWHGTKVVEERFTDGAKRRYWSNGVEELNAAGTQTGKRFLMKDHLGSTRVVLDGAGATVASYDYDPWGVRRKLSGSGEEGVGYTGHWTHESGLVMAPYRVYEPGLGRWLSEDPIFEAGGVNLYGYVGNGPVGRWDPLGLCPDHPGLIDGQPKRSGQGVDMNLHGPGVKNNPTSNPNLGWDSPDTFTVMGHSGLTTVLDQTRAPADMNDPDLKSPGKNGVRTLSPKQLADLIRDHEKFPGSNDVLLYTCSSGRLGKNSFAQMLADELGMVVWAATDDVLLSMWEPGGGYVANGGSYKPFFPRTYR
jgi:RHS repeat-associated protein